MDVKFAKTVAERSQKASDLLGSSNAAMEGDEEFKELFPETSGVLLKGRFSHQPHILPPVMVDWNVRLAERYPSGYL